MKLREEQTFGIARKIKANMTGESWETITHSVVSYEADVTELMPLIKKMNEGVDKAQKQRPRRQPRPGAETSNPLAPAICVLYKKTLTASNMR